MSAKKCGSFMSDLLDESDDSYWNNFSRNMPILTDEDRRSAESSANTNSYADGCVASFLGIDRFKWPEKQASVVAKLILVGKNRHIS